ncbi:M12 family metallopeptidase [Pseudomonas brenneri]|uniref:M12 family metallopeptidase n=1 Tax=Pseudomonas brenneri TaxID=129817 RepID=UPI003570DC32
MTITISPVTPSQQPLGEQSQLTEPHLTRNKRGVASLDRTWPQHSVLKISLLNMTAEQKQVIKDNIKKWAPHTNLFFKFTDKPDGDIRITADNKTKAAWSRIGTDAQRVPVPEPTMSIGFARSPASVAATIQHEFGHALGLRHEHQHPDRTLDLNKAQIYKKYESLGKKRHEANHDIIRPFPRGEVKLSTYDQDSIMHYGFPKSLVNDEKAISKPTQLSEGDKDFIQSVYPADNSLLGKLLNTTIRKLVSS